MNLGEFLILENLYVATNSIKLFALEQRVWLFINLGSLLGGHLGCHLRFTLFDMPDVFFLNLVELLICENLYFATNFIMISALEQKLRPFVVQRWPIWNYAN